MITKRIDEEEYNEIVKRTRKETLIEVEKIIDVWDFYELREELRMFCFDDDKNYVSEFKKKVKQQLNKLNEKSK